MKMMLKAVLLVAFLGLVFAGLLDELKVEMPDGVVEGCIVGCRNGYRRHPSDCRKFLQCTPSGPQELPCPQGTVWDQSELICNHEDVVACDVGFYLTSEGARCPGKCQFQCPTAKFARYPHPRDCKKFFACNQGVASFKSCGAGLHFDTVTGQCTDADVATCNASPDAEC